MAKKDRKGGSGDEGGGYNYMDTYGDLVTLLLCFFVLLYSFSSVDSAKWQELVMALSSGGASVVMDPLDPGPPILDDDTGTDADENEEQKEIDQDFSELYEKIKGYVGDNGLDTKVMVEKDDIFIRVSFIDDDIMFQSGRADLSEQAPAILDSVGEIIYEHEPNIASIDIEGHTDTNKIHTAKYPSNWELSSDRALEVARYMMYDSKVSDQIDHGKYAPKAMGEYHPIDTNETEEGRARNRRVVFLITERVAVPVQNQSEF